MKCFVVVNRLADVGFRQTTALLSAAANRLGQEVVLANVDDVTLVDRNEVPSFHLSGIRLADTSTSSKLVADSANNEQPTAQFEVEAGTDLVFIRTNPGRDIQRETLHRRFLELMMQAEEQGVRVVNAPEHLFRFASKASLLELEPRYRPEMLVTSNVPEVVDFIDAASVDCVVKPVLGSRGANVLRLNASTTGLQQLLKDTFANTEVIAQHFVHADHPGDRRVIVFDGRILESAGGIAGIERHPAAGDFRANLHAGGTAHPLKLTPNERDAANHAGELLMEHGIRLAGVDMIGDKVIEFNVFSTGGFFDANRFAKTDFAEVVMRCLLRND